MADASGSPRGISRALWILFFITLTMPFWNLGHPLWEVDDARYAEIPREMVELHDWITPHLDYVEYLEKPPLIYWLGASCYRLFGVSERTAHLPLALLAVIGIVGTFWLGSWLFSPATGIIGAIILGTCIEYSLLSHLQTPDMAVAVFLLWTCALILRVLHHPEDSLWAGTAAGAAMALAFLSKGLIACVFPGIWVLLIAWLFPNLRRGLKALLLSGALPLFALIVGTWLWQVTSRHPDFPHHFFIEQHFLRYLTPHYNRTAPWYYFIGIDFGGMLPWTPAVIAAIGLTLVRWKKAAPEMRELVVWIALIFVFFSASKSKLPTYILPLFPQQALLTAEYFRQLKGDGAAEAWLRAWSLRLGILIWILLPVGLAAWRWGNLPPMVTNQVVVAGFVILLQLGGALIALATLRAEDPVPAVRRVGLVAVALTAMMLIGAGQLSPYLSARDLGREIASQYRLGDKIFSFDFYLHGVPFYTGRPVDSVINWLGELDYAARNPRYKHIVGDEGMIRALPEPGHTTFVVLPRKSMPYFITLARPNSIKKTKTFGDWTLAIF